MRMQWRRPYTARPKPSRAFVPFPHELCGPRRSPDATLSDDAGYLLSLNKSKIYFSFCISSASAVEVRSSGGKTFYLRYQDQHDRQKAHKIGAVGDISFDKARKEAQRFRSEVMLGGDPPGKKARIKAIPTYADVAADPYLKDREGSARAVVTGRRRLARADRAESDISFAAAPILRATSRASNIPGRRRATRPFCPICASMTFAIPRRAS